MMKLETYLAPFEDYLSQHPFQGEPASLYEPANYMMQLGGKRLRPAMVLMACDAFQGSFKEAFPAAMAIEVFHNFTLVHDDIMDAAPLRRGKTTVHIKWDHATAILCGDMMMFKAVLFLQELPVTLLQEALSMFNKTAIEVCEGQQIDMVFEQRKKVEIAEYIHMITLKTSVLLGCSFYLGARIGGAPKEAASAMYEFGKNLGIAFQLHDDLLDAFAEDAVAFGKQVGGDILSNKKTYLLITALQNADSTQRELLNGWLQNSDINPEAKVAAMKELFVLTGAKKATEQAQQNYYNVALEALQAVPLSSEWKVYLQGFAQLVMQRSK